MAFLLESENDNNLFETSETTSEDNFSYENFTLEDIRNSLRSFINSLKNKDFRMKYYSKHRINRRDINEIIEFFQDIVDDKVFDLLSISKDNPLNLHDSALVFEIENKEIIDFIYVGITSLDNSTIGIRPLSSKYNAHELDPIIPGTKWGIMKIDFK